MAAKVQRCGRTAKFFRRKSIIVVITSGLSTKISGLSMKISSLSMITSGLSMKMNGLSMKKNGLSMSAVGLRPLVGFLIRHPPSLFRHPPSSSALPSQKSPISSGFFCRKYIYIVKKRDIPHIPHISHVKMLQQAASTEVLKLFHVRDVRDVRDVFFCLPNIYARAKRWTKRRRQKKHGRKIAAVLDDSCWRWGLLGHGLVNILGLIAASPCSGFTGSPGLEAGIGLSQRLALLAPLEAFGHADLLGSHASLSSEFV